MNKEQYIDFPHPEYSNTYKVSNFGNIKNNKTNKLVTTCKSFDYVCIRIDNVIFRVNKLVARCFIGDSNLHIVHIDGDKNNNMITNLKYVNVIDYLKNIYKEEWKEINDYKGYFVSSIRGKIWSLVSEKILTTTLSYGYHRVNLGGKKNSKKKYIHRLVGEAFIVNPNNYEMINHKNGIKTDCSVVNLEWVTRSENSLHSIRILGNNNLSSQSNKKCEKPCDATELTCHKNYLITKDAKIYSIKNEKYIIPHIRPDGYVCVQIGKKRHKLHRLVATTFLPTPSKEKIFVNHKNLNRSDNRLENLEWVSPSENTKHQIDSDPNRYKNQQRKVACIDKDTEEVIAIYDSLALAAKDKGIKSSGNISNVCRGTTKTTGGYKWKYIE